MIKMIKHYSYKSPDIQDWRNKFTVCNSMSSIHQLYKNKHIRINQKTDIILSNCKLLIQEYKEKTKQRTTLNIEFQYIKNKKIELKVNYCVEFKEKTIRYYNEVKTYLIDFKNRIKEFKQKARQPNCTSITKIYKGNAYKIIKVGNNNGGFVNNKPGVYLNLFNSNNIKKIFKYKAPSSQDKYIGVELEFMSKKTHEELAEIFFYNKLTPFLHLKNDESIQVESGYNKAEIAILCKENEYNDIVTKVCNLLNSNESKINTSCGMHIHLDMRNRNVKECFNNLVISQPILYAMNPKSRQNNKYCKETKRKTLEITGDNGNRYQGINPEAFNKHQTLEVRIHAGTLNAVKINNWIKLLLSIINTKEMFKTKPRYFRTFIKKFNIDLELADYIAKRIDSFSKDETLGENN